MFDWKAIGNEAGREVIERYMHQTVSEHIKDALARGDDAGNIVVQAIIRIRDSKLLKLAHDTLGTKVTGLAITGLGSLVAGWLQSIDWRTFMPEEKSDVMREVRWILQVVVPSLVVGASEGAADTFEEDVRTAVRKVVADKSSNVPQKPGLYDFVFEVQSFDGTDYMKEYGLLFPEWDAQGNLQYDKYNAVILAGVKGRQFAIDWYKVHKEHEKEVPVETPPPQNDNNQNGRGGNRNQNQQPRTKKITVPPEPYQGRLVPLAVALQRVPETMPMDPELIALAKAALTPKAPVAPKKIEVGPKGLLLMRLLTQKVATRSPLEQKLIIDLVNDIANNPEKINHLGDMFVTDANTASGLSDEDYLAIRTHLQMWLGSTLTFENKLRLAFEHAKHVFDNAKDPATGALLATGERFELAIGTLAQTVGKFVLAGLVVMAALFAMLLALVVMGAFCVKVDYPVSYAPFGVFGTKVVQLVEFSSWELLYYVPAVICILAGLRLRIARVSVLGRSVPIPGVRMVTGWRRFLWVVFVITTLIPPTIFIITDLLHRLEPREFAAGLVLFAGFAACIELFSFTFFQGLLSLVTRFLPNVPKNWLVNKGRVAVYFIAIHVGIFVILLAFKTPLLLRLIICVPTMFALGSQLGFGGYDFSDEAIFRARKTLRLFAFMSSLVFVATIATIIMWLSDVSVSDVWTLFKDSKISQTILLLAVFAYPIGWGVRRIENTYRNVRHGVLVTTRWRPIWWLRVLGVALWLFIGLWPWIGSRINEFSEKKPAVAQAAADSGSSTKKPATGGSAPVIKAPEPEVSSPSSPVRRKHSGGAKRSSKSCKELGYPDDFCAELEEENP